MAIQHISHYLSALIFFIHTTDIDSSAIFEVCAMMYWGGELLSKLQSQLLYSKMAMQHLSHYLSALSYYPYNIYWIKF